MDWLGFFFTYYYTESNLNQDIDQDLALDLDLVPDADIDLALDPDPDLDPSEPALNIAAFIMAFVCRVGHAPKVQRQPKRPS